MHYFKRFQELATPITESNVRSSNDLHMSSETLVNVVKLATNVRAQMEGLQYMRQSL